jgi:hypothetical protein
MFRLRVGFPSSWWRNPKCVSDITSCRLVSSNRRFGRAWWSCICQSTECETQNDLYLNSNAATNSKSGILYCVLRPSPPDVDKLMSKQLLRRKPTFLLPIGAALNGRTSTSFAANKSSFIHVHVDQSYVLYKVTYTVRAICFRTDFF